MANADIIHVEIAYAEPQHQAIIPMDVPSGTTVMEAVRHSGIVDEFPQLDVDKCKLGIFGKLGQPEQLLKNGDRVELYRPLIADPKEVRRKLALEGKTMGGKKKPSST